MKNLRIRRYSSKPPKGSLRQVWFRYSGATPFFWINEIVLVGVKMVLATAQRKSLTLLFFVNKFFSFELRTE